MAAPISAMAVEPAQIAEIGGLRAAVLAEASRQLVHESFHGRGLADYFVLRANGDPVGYAALSGESRAAARTTLFEIYLGRGQRRKVEKWAEAAIAGSGTRRIRAQTNDPLLAPALRRFCRRPTLEAILFEAGEPASLAFAGAQVRPRANADTIFTHQRDPVGDYVLVHDGVAIATGGLATHYNPPFADVFLEVAPVYRGRGAGSFLVQELIRIGRHRGLTPAARCGPDNPASRAALLRGGMRVCAELCSGDVEP